MSIGLVHDATLNVYPPVDNDQPSYELEIENSWHGRQFKIKNSKDKKQTIFQRKQIFINGFCAKYLKGFNKTEKNRFQNPVGLKILGKKCYIQYENLNILFKCVNVSITNWEDKERPVILPLCLKIAGLKRYIHENSENSFNYKLSILFHDNIYLENPFTLNYYDICENYKLDFYKKKGDNEESRCFDRKNLWISPIEFLSFQSKISELSDLVCYLKSTRGNGTGFLIGEDKILTNFHVVLGMEEPYQITFFFNKDKEEVFDCTIVNPLNALYFSKNRGDKSPDTKKNCLDFAIIEIPKDFLFKMEKNPNWKLMQKLACEFFIKKNILTAAVGMPANIIHFPGTPTKKIVFQSNEFIQVGDDTYHYSTHTIPGSSGSPIISNEGKFLGYHYASCDKIKNEAERILININNNNNNNNVEEFVYVDKTNKLIQWVVRSNATCKQIDNEKNENKEVSLALFLEKYNGSLDVGDDKPEFFDKRLIKIHKKHRYCKCGIPAILLKKDPAIKKIFEDNENYLKKPSSEQPQPSATSQKDLEKKNGWGSFVFSGKTIALGLVGIAAIAGAAGAIAGYLATRKNK